MTLYARAQARFPIAESACCLLACAALWRVLPKISQRWFAPWGSSLGAVLLVVAVLCWLRIHLAERRARGFGPARFELGARALAVASALLVCYAVTFERVPVAASCHLAAAVGGALAFASLPTPVRQQYYGLSALVLLSTHVASAWQFYCGYPLRVFAAELAAGMLGGAVEAQGTGLTSDAGCVFVDAPCSGVRMLLVGLVLANGVSAYFKLGFVRTVCVNVVSALLIVLGNAQRAAILYVLRFPADSPEHTAIGVLVFLECALVLYFVARWTARGLSPKRNDGARARWGHAIVFVSACAFAGSATLANIETPRELSVDQGEFAWPETWNGEALVAQPIDVEVARALCDFPGRLRQCRLEPSGLRVLLRTCTRATSDLHDARRCYLARGCAVAPMDPLREEDGRLWSRFEVTEADGRRLVVRHCYVSVLPPREHASLEGWIDGRPSWPDASSWYWGGASELSEATFTLAITVALPVDM